MRYSLDIAAFHIDWEDIQVIGQVNDFGVNLNGGEATSDGVEFTAMARLSDGFSVSLNGAYTDAQLEDDTPPESGGLKGDALPFTPEWSLGLNADYEWSVGAQSTAYVGGALRYLSDQTGTYDLGYRTENGASARFPRMRFSTCRPAWISAATRSSCTGRTSPTATAGLRSARSVHRRTARSAPA